MTKKKKTNEPDVPPTAEEQVEVPQSEEALDQPVAQPQTVEQERDELLARLQRLAADYQNYQKRTAKEAQQARQYANESLMKEMIPVLDDMERALAAAEENNSKDDPLLAGMQMVYDKMFTTLGRFGLTRLESQDQPFDPDKHLAMMQQPTADVEPMTVMQELQKGDQLKGRTIRPASVIVSKEPEDQEDQEEDK